MFRLQFFASPSCDSSGNGEGQTFIGEANLMTGPNCTNGFALGFDVPVAPGSAITATATDPAGNTSEFSACTTVMSSPVLNIGTTNATQLALVWPQSATTAFKLKQTDNLLPPIVWSPVTDTVVLSGGYYQVVLSPSFTNRFYSLLLE
jgi:hypothetical protein